MERGRWRGWVCVFESVGVGVVWVFGRGLVGGCEVCGGCEVDRGCEREVVRGGALVGCCEVGG